VRAPSQREVAEAQHRIFRNVTRVILGLVVLALVIACMAVFNMVMGTIHGRIRDIGLLKVLGASRWQLVRVLSYEAVALGVIGGVLGYGLGLALALTVGPWLVSGAVITLHWWEPLLAVTVAVVTSLLATLYPALHASRISVADAFRARPEVDRDK
jgi:putative ABC transport system permease protein